MQNNQPLIEQDGFSPEATAEEHSADNINFLLLVGFEKLLRFALSFHSGIGRVEARQNLPVVGLESHQSSEKNPPRIQGKVL